MYKHVGEYTAVQIQIRGAQISVFCILFLENSIHVKSHTLESLVLAFITGKRKSCIGNCLVY